MRERERGFIMIEANVMGNPSNSLDASELIREEDKLTDITVGQESLELCYRHATHVSGSETQYQGREYGPCEDSVATNIDCNYDDAVTFSLINNKSITEMPELNHVLQNGFKSHGQASDVKSDIIQSERCFASVEWGSGRDATAELEGHADCPIPESSHNDVSVHFSSDAEENVNERLSSAVATSSDGPSSFNCFSGWDMDGESPEIAFCSDYLEYGGACYWDSTVRFYESFIEAKGRTTYGKEETFHIHLEIDDIAKIESQWSAQFATGTINIYVNPKDAAEANGDHKASGIQELKFPTHGSDWYKKQEAIESLNARYKALWCALLDTGLENHPALPEGETIAPTRSYFPSFDKPFEEVVYPKGDPDAVSISKRDVDLLLPDTFVNDTVIDFYIKHLKAILKEEERTKFHFFNSFFFRKLADMDKDPSSAFDGKAAFLRVHKWTRKVNLLAKDFIFIPVNYNYHWSLIVICYFSEVANYAEVEDRKSVKVPCVLHMDSLRGNHIGLKDLMQSYLWEEWKERHKGTSDDLNSKFRSLKFVHLELPQQPNLFDCGLFLLHYVERFLEEVPANFSIYQITPSTSFLQENWFPPGEASMKRAHIGRLINDLLDTRSEECTSSGGGSMHSSAECPTTANDNENGIEFSAEPCPCSSCHEIPLITSSLRDNLCSTTSELVIKELFEQPSVSESFNEEPWGSLDSKEKIEDSKCFVPTEKLPDGMTTETHAFVYSSGDFKLEPPAPDVVDSSPVTSELLNPAEPHGFVGIPVATGVPTNVLPGFCQETSPSQANHASSHKPLSVSAAFTCSLSEARSPNQIGICCDDAHPHSGPPAMSDNTLTADDPFPDSEEQHTAKRMRMTPPDSSNDVTAAGLSSDLNL